MNKLSISNKFFQQVIGNSGYEWWVLFVLYAVLQLSRLLMVILFYPILSRMGYGMNWKNATILVWSGLRGVYLMKTKSNKNNRCCRFVIRFGNQTRWFDSHWNKKSCQLFYGRFSYLFFIYLTNFHILGSVFLTLVLNGATSGYLYRTLRFVSFTPPAKEIILNAVQDIERKARQKIEKLKVIKWIFYY